MQAVVLAGGLGTRLRPLTETIPKQLLPVGGVPVIERVLAHLASHGVDRAVLSMGHLPDPFLAAYPARRIAGVEVSFAIEPTALGTAGAIRYAGIEGGIDDTFLAVNGDVLTDLDVSALIAAHEAAGAEGTIALTPVEDPSAYGVVVTDATALVTAFVEKPPASTAPSKDVNAGTYVLEPTFFDRVSSGVAVSIEREVFPAMVEDRCLYAIVDTSYWLDAGTVSTYLRANTDVVDGLRAASSPLELVDGSLQLGVANVAPSASVHRSVVGRDAAIGVGATVDGSVLMDGATIGAGATVRDSVVGPGASVGAGAVLVGNCLVAASARVPDGARLDGSKVPA